MSAEGKDVSAEGKDVSAEGKDVSAGDGPERYLRIVAGSPSPEEIAVIVAVLSARPVATDRPPAWSLWARKSRMVKPSLRPGFGAWRASVMPR